MRKTRWQKTLRFTLSLLLVVSFSAFFLSPKVMATRENWPTLTDIEATAYLVADVQSESIHIQHNIDEALYPASLTKIMTALLLIESGRLEETVTVSETAVDLAYDMARTGFLLGEEVVLRDVLYALMLTSGNDAARLIAETLGGDLEGFSQRMNERADELGMQKTHFRNPSGLPDEAHVTTAADMWKLTLAAMQNETFREVVATPTYAMPATNLQPYDGWALLQSSNAFLTFGTHGQILASPYYQAYTGIKTGTTRAAGYCLAASALSWEEQDVVVLIFGVPREWPRALLYQYSHVLFEEGAKKMSLATQPTKAPTPTLTPSPTPTDRPLPTPAESEEEGKLSSEDDLQATTTEEGFWRPLALVLLVLLPASWAFFLLHRRKKKRQNGIRL